MRAVDESVGSKSCSEVWKREAKIGSGVTYDKPAFADDDAAWTRLRQFAAARSCAMRLP